MKYLYCIVDENNGDIIDGFKNRNDAIMYIVDRFQDVHIQTRITKLKDNKTYRQTYGYGQTIEEMKFQDEFDFAIECYDPQTLTHVIWEDEQRELCKEENNEKY